MFRVSKSQHPKQLSFAKRPRKQKLLLKGGILFMGLSLTAVAFLWFPRLLTPLWDLYQQKPLVNIHYPGFLGGFGITGIAFLMAAYSAIVHDRIIVPEELTPFWRRVCYASLVGGTIFGFCAAILLSLATWPLISAGGYSRCAEMSQGAKWNSYWALDQSLCVKER